MTGFGTHHRGELFHLLSDMSRRSASIRAAHEREQRITHPDRLYERLIGSMVEEGKLQIFI